MYGISSLSLIVLVELIVRCLLESAADLVVPLALQLVCVGRLHPVGYLAIAHPAELKVKLLG